MSHLEQHVCKVEPQEKEAETVVASEKKEQTPMEVLLDRKAPWREELRKAMKPKERTAIHRCPMNELDPVYRATTRTEEVNTGYTKEQAMIPLIFAILRLQSFIN